MFGLENKKKEKKRVMIVEDDALLAKAIASAVIDSGFEITVVPDGLEALDMVKVFKPHLILLDLILPGLDGFEVMKRLKNDSQTDKIPIFVVSNLASASDVKSVKVLGAEEYFIKANTELESIVRTVKKRLK